MIAVMIALTGLLCIDPELPIQPVDHVTMVKASGEDVTVRWEPASDDPEPTDYYDIRFHSFEWCTVEEEEQLDGELREYTFTLPRMGHFIASIRACNTNGCSEWAESINPEFTQWQGERRSWWIYAYLPAPTGGGLD